jgi:hypothetical protein
MTKDDAVLVLTLLRRVTLTGEEVQGFLRAVAAVQDSVKEEPEALVPAPKVKKEKAK